MKKLFYPAIFQIKENGYIVYFPDVEGCSAEGSDMQKAYETASEALGLVLSYLKNEKKELPTPSAPQDIKTSENEFVAVIEFDMMEYLKKHNGKAVKKTLSIPQWLNEEAMSRNINFSNVLQEALIERIENN